MGILADLLMRRELLRSILTQGTAWRQMFPTRHFRPQIESQLGERYDFSYTGVMAPRHRPKLGPPSVPPPSVQKSAAEFEREALEAREEFEARQKEYYEEKARQKALRLGPRTMEIPRASTHRGDDLFYAGVHEGRRIPKAPPARPETHVVGWPPPERIAVGPTGESPRAGRYDFTQ